MRPLLVAVLAACHASPRPAAPAPPDQQRATKKGGLVDGVPDWAADRAKIQRFVARKK